MRIWEHRTVRVDEVWKESSVMEDWKDMEMLEEMEKALHLEQNGI